MGKTSTQAKDKYNEREYARYTLRVRKDSYLFEQIESCRAREAMSLNRVVVKLLEDFFEGKGIEELNRIDGQ